MWSTNILNKLVAFPDGQFWLTILVFLFPAVQQ